MKPPLQIFRRRPTEWVGRALYFNYTLISALVVCGFFGLVCLVLLASPVAMDSVESVAP